VFIRFYNCSDSVVVYMFVNGIGGGSILLLCLLDCIAVLRVWLSICLLGGIGGDSILRLCLLDFVVVLTMWLSICLVVVSVLALFYYCVY
jgi:hypothetical protein